MCYLRYGLSNWMVLILTNKRLVSPTLSTRVKKKKKESTHQFNPIFHAPVELRERLFLVWKAVPYPNTL